MKRYKAAILGATGIIGQQFSRMLTDHPLFEIQHFYASTRSAGKSMRQIWELPFYDCPEAIGERIIENIEDMKEDIDIVFSALPSQYALQIEENLRDKGIAVFSNAGSHRMDDDVPILIPEINAEHSELISVQRETNGTQGFIVTNSNCSAAGAAIYLGELDRITPVQTAVVSTYQAISGAGIGGVSALDISNNVIPYIGNEEPKIIEETLKITGNFEVDGIVPNQMNVIANAARVGVIDGHLQAITALIEDQQFDITSKLEHTSSQLDVDKYHIAPRKHLMVRKELDRPQPAKDVFLSDSENAEGMTVHTGRIRQNPTDISAFVLVHNTIRGGAGGSILNAEYAIHEGYM